MFTTYILFSESTGLYYIGSTGNLTDRLHRYNTRRSTFTKVTYRK